MSKKIIILASGGGSNARAILEYFKSNDNVSVAMILTNNPNAGVLKIAEEYNVISKVIAPKELVQEELLASIKEINPSLIILAGYLKKIPQDFLVHFPNKIINIHPALLPKYGGKGMYGINVHQAVKDNGDSESGITIHMVNQHYDEGLILLQAHCPIDTQDDAHDIAAKVLKLEHFYYPRLIEYLLVN